MSTELTQAIERLYVAFGHYLLPDHVDMSPYRNREQEVGAMYRTPLRELSADDLMAYSFHALTTVGDVNLFKYIMPRLLELTAEHLLLANPEIVLSKFDHGSWRAWPRAEQEVLEMFLNTWLTVTFTRETWNSDMNAGTVLTSIAQAEQELGRYLAIWENATHSAATHQLAEWLALLADEEAWTLGPPAFLGEESPQWCQIRAWLLRPATLARLRQGQVDAQRDGYMDEYNAYPRSIQLLGHLLPGDHR